MGTPAYTRLENDERRRRLLELGTRLFTEHAYDEISMAQIAREAGISKALLYHYFPSKQDYFMATLAGGAEALRARWSPTRAAAGAGADHRAGRLPGLDRGQRRRLRQALPQRSGRARGARARRRRARGDGRRILDGLGAADNARARTAVRGWLWFMDGACLDWIAHRDLSRAELHGLLLGTLAGALVRGRPG